MVTIIGERILKDRLAREIRQLGAKGFTITDAHGEGSRGVRASEWEGPDVKMEAVVSEEVSGRILDHIARQYFEHFAVIVYAQDVEVVRGDKYV